MQDQAGRAPAEQGRTTQGSPAHAGGSGCGASKAAPLPWQRARLSLSLLKTFIIKITIYCHSLFIFVLPELLSKLVFYLQTAEENNVTNKLKWKDLL